MPVTVRPVAGRGRKPGEAESGLWRGGFSLSEYRGIKRKPHLQDNKLPQFKAAPTKRQFSMADWRRKIACVSYL